MKFNLIKAKEISPLCKGYLVGINNNYILEGGMFSFKTKKLGEKFIKRIIELIKEGKITSLNDIKEQYNVCTEVIEEKNNTMDIVRCEYFNLFKQGLLSPISNDAQLFDFAENNKERLKDKVTYIEDFLYYCI